MSKRKINWLLKWWVTPKLPNEDIFEKHNFFTQWVIHPIKRRFAKLYLKFLKSRTEIKIIGVTGSAGKSTTVRMLHSILKEVGKTVSTPPSIDPVYNIPNTILRTPPWTKFLILEMSVEYPGEMDYYLWLAKPDVGLVINIFSTHTLFFGNIKGVYKEKRKLVTNLRKGDKVILNKANPYTKRMGKLSKAEITWFGDGSDITAQNKVTTKILNIKYTLSIKKSKIDVRLSFFGNQFIKNSLAAAAVGHSLGVSLEQIKKGLETYQNPEHRMKIIKHKSGALIVDDSYNNNPQAAIEAIDTFKEIVGVRKTIIVMGDMLELGRLEEKEHKKIGEYIGEKKIKVLIGVGPASKDMVVSARKGLGKNNTYWVQNQKEVMLILKKYLKKENAILIKGSRSIALDKVADRLS